MHEQQLLRIMIRHRLIGIMTQERFIDSINEGTTRPTSVCVRFDPWYRVLQSIVADPNEVILEGDLLCGGLNETRFCERCAYELTPDDAVWLPIGGKPTLVHRFCQVFETPQAA